MNVSSLLSTSKCNMQHSQIHIS